MQETIIFRDNGVIVTPTMVTIAGVTYPLIAISSIRVKRQGLGLIFTVLSILILLLGILLCIGDLKAAGIILIIFSLLFLFSKPKYHLIITNASGESVALTTKEQDYADKIRKQIEHAIAGGKKTEPYV